MKIMYVIYSWNGFRGSEYYPTREQAEQAATLRTNLTGKPWHVETICV